MAQASTFAAGVRVASRAPVKRASVRTRPRRPGWLTWHAARSAAVARSSALPRRSGRSEHARVADAARPAQAVRACATVARQAAWSPGSEAPAHLDGSLPADFGTSPASDPADARRGIGYQGSATRRCAAAEAAERARAVAAQLWPTPRPRLRRFCAGSGSARQRKAGANCRIETRPRRLGAAPRLAPFRGNGVLASAKRPRLRLRAVRTAMRALHGASVTIALFSLYPAPRNARCTLPRRADGRALRRLRSFLSRS